MEQEPGFEFANKSQLIADTVRRYGIDDDICDEIAGMDPVDAYSIAYDTLDLAGENPDAILAPFMEEPYL